MSHVIRPTQFLSPKNLRLTGKFNFQRHICCCLSLRVSSLDSKHKNLYLITCQTYNGTSNCSTSNSINLLTWRKGEISRYVNYSRKEYRTNSLAVATKPRDFASVQRPHIHQGNGQQIRVIKDRFSVESARFDWMTQLKTIPNLLTLARMCSAPLLAYWIVAGQNEFAFAGCFVACVSDVADGYIARKYNMTTTLGTYLDPLCTFVKATL
jgi:CDP-alcohol phosphatidyltransferase